MLSYNHYSFTPKALEIVIFSVSVTETVIEELYIKRLS